MIPKPVFPLALDSDYTLFNTFNGSQSTLVKALAVDETEIEIRAKNPNDPEVWADNGFVTIEDELVYYDKVKRNGSGKVYLLQDCLRGVEGKPKNYRAGQAVYANVVAQIHNQLAQAIINIEHTIGDIGDMLKLEQTPTPELGMMGAPQVDTQFAASMGASLNSLMGFAPLGDDACPDVEFNFNMVDTTTAEWCVRIYGAYNSFEIAFGDGNSTTTELAGTHVYAAPGPYNATVTVQAPNCLIVQQPTTPNEACSIPTLPSTVPYHIRIPEVPPFPRFIAPRAICPGPLFNLPPIIIPNPIFCSSITPNTGCSVTVSVTCCQPSVISFGPVPSFDCISFCAVPSWDCIPFCEFPSIAPISFAPFPEISRVSFVVDVSLAPLEFGPVPSFECISFCVPPLISFADFPVIPPISFADFPSMARISFDVLVDLSLSPICFCEPPSFECISFCPPPAISVDWGIPPLVSMILICGPSSTQMTATPMLMDMIGGQPEEDSIPIAMNEILPDKIEVVVPKIPNIKLEHNLPGEIFIRMPDFKLPTLIEVKSDIPHSIEVRSDIPKSIPVDFSSMPTKIMVEPAPNFPSTIVLDAKVEVLGIPKSIELVYNGPQTIQLVMPKDPVVEMVYRGSPVPFDFHVHLDINKALSDVIVVNPGS